MIYSMRWEVRVTPRGRRLLRLVASARRTSDSDSGLSRKGGANVPIDFLLAGRLADSNGQRLVWEQVLPQPRGQEQAGVEVTGGCGVGGLADTQGERRDGAEIVDAACGAVNTNNREHYGRAEAAGGGDSNRTDSGWEGSHGGASWRGGADRFFCPRDGHEVRGLCEDGLEQPGEPIPDSQWICCADCRPSPPDSPWRDPDWLFCRDGKWRPVESSVQRLAHGISGSVVQGGAFVPASSPLSPSKADRRVMRLKGYGNAIVPQVGAEVIRAFLDSSQTTQPVEYDLEG